MVGEEIGRSPISEKADLQIALLGAPTVSWRGQPLDVPRRQVRALLFGLAATLQPIPRERLGFLFWPDMPESEARRNLSRLLSHLRDALPDPTVVLTSGDSIELDARRVSSDVVTFRRLASRRDEIEHLRQAAQLYRGPFLAGFSLAGSPEFEAWVQEQQRDCEQRYLEVLAVLIETLTERRAYDEAITYARRYLVIDELAEEIHRRLITLYAATGDRSAAQRQFESCVAALERELGVRALPETREAYVSALNGRDRRAMRAGPALAWTTLPSLDLPLVGREAPFEALSEAWSSACAGQGRVVLISGEPGIGKSRLMEAFAARVGGRAVVLVAAGRCGDQTLPYQPVAEILRSLPDWQALSAPGHRVWLAEAARVLPELREFFPDLPRPLTAEPDEARLRLLDALCQLTMRLARGPRPLLICLDDLHWADSATLDWLSCLARHMAEQRTGLCPLLILGAYRVEERHAIAELRRRLLRLDLLSEMELSGLKPDSVLKIVRQLVDARPGITPFSRRLHRATGGNPFFLLETLRALQEAGQLSDDLSALQEVPLPDSVRQAIEARLGRVAPKARQVLEAGAILGAPFDFDLVRRTAGRGEMETIDGLDAAVSRHLLIEDSSGYRFRHALIRRTVHRSLGPVRRHLLHRRAARALKRIDPGASLRIAHHFELGGEEEKALHHYQRAAQQAEDLFAWQEVEEIQGRMLALLDRLDPDRSQLENLALRGHILTSRAHARYLQGRLEDRDTDLDALAALAEASADENLRLETLVHRVRYLNLDAKYKEALRLAEEGLELADRLHSEQTRSRLLAQIGFAHYFLGQPRPALTALESALVVAGEEADPEMRGRITHILGYVSFHLGDYARSLSYQREAYACHQAVDNHNRMAWDGLDIGALHLELGRFAEAREHLAEHLALARRIGAQPAEAYGLTLLGCWELHRGSYLSALDRCREALSMQRDLRSEHGSTAAELGMGLALHRLGEVARARRRLKRAAERARSIAHRRRLAEALVGLGLVEIEAGRLDVAHRSLTEAVAVARDSECWESVAAGLDALARAERRRAKMDRALSHARESTEVAQRHNLPVGQSWAEMEAGLALFALGDLAGALEHTERAVANVSKLHEAWIGSEEVHRAHARVLEALDRTEEACEQRQLAEAVIQAKADRIPDPEVRRRYLQHVTVSPSSPIN